MATPPHQPAYHILNNTFTEKNNGLPVPTRRYTEVPEEIEICRTDWGSTDGNTLAARFRLRISNLSHLDPPGYNSGDYPRGGDFNANAGDAFNITGEPRMPVIPVECEVGGFDPAITPLRWRLQCRHVLCRHKNMGHYRYGGVCEVLDSEWQGKSRAANFKLFAPVSSETVDYDYNTNMPETVVMGGHAILSVAALPPGCIVVLQDYVHLRIGGTNPTQDDVTAYIDRLVGSRNPNLPHILNACFAHESGMTQFKRTRQRSANMTFKQKHHHNAAQPDCTVLFDWPDDPAHFPLATFDWGIGATQYTKVGNRVIGAATAWDWRENVRAGMNELLDAMADSYKPSKTWRQWAHQAWRDYNGSGAQAEAYADTVEASAEGQLVSTTAVPADIDVGAITRKLPAPVELGAPPDWPHLFAPGDYETSDAVRQTA